MKNAINAPRTPQPPLGLNLASRAMRPPMRAMRNGHAQGPAQLSQLCALIHPATATEQASPPRCIRLEGQRAQLTVLVLPAAIVQDASTPNWARWFVPLQRWKREGCNTPIAPWMRPPALFEETGLHLTGLENTGISHNPPCAKMCRRIACKIDYDEIVQTRTRQAPSRQEGCDSM